MSKSIKDFKSVSGKKYDGMMGRCYRNSDVSYKNYGGRGIRVAAEWIRDIETFRIWLSNHLVELALSEEDFIQNSSRWHLDRIDPNQHYTPENCRIASQQQNARNKRNVQRKHFEAADGSIVTL